MIGFGRLKGFLAGFVRAGDHPSRSPSPTVLVIGGSEAADRAASPDWRLLTAATLEDAQKAIAGAEVAIALCDRDAPGVDWRHAVPALAGTPSRPCVVLLTSSEDCLLWEQVTAMGGYDVLRKPIDGEILARTIRAGISHWRSSRALESARTQQTVR